MKQLSTPFLPRSFAAPSLNMLPLPGGGGDEFEVDFDTLSSGLLGDVTPEMLRFLTGASVHNAAVPTQVPAEPPALPLGSRSAENSSKQQRAAALLTEQSLADGSFEAGLAPFQLLVSQSDGLPAHDSHDTSSIPTENDSILRNLSDFGSRDSSGSDNGARFNSRRRPAPTAAAASTFRSAASTRGRSSASGATGDASKPLPLSSVVQMQQAMYKVRTWLSANA
jgi:hypothetical protein